MILAATFFLFFYAIKTGRTEEEARSFGFASLVLSNIFLISVNLSWDKGIFRILKEANKVFFFVFFGALFSLLAVLYIPYFSHLFHLSPINLNDFILVAGISFIGVIWFEIVKIFNKKLRIN